MSGALARQDEGFFSEEQQKIIRDSFLGGASAAEAAMLFEVSKSMRLSPLKRQIFFVKRWDSQKRTEVWAFQVSIDGLRAIAERTGLYDGQDEPDFEEEKEHPRICKVRVWRKGISRPFVGVAYWDEYVQKTKDGNVTQMWAKFKHVMLAKCAEALALRKAFPEELAGAYVPEEMSQEKDVSDAPVKRGLESIPSKATVTVLPPEPSALPADTKPELLFKKRKISELETGELREAIAEMVKWLDNPRNARNAGRAQSEAKQSALISELAMRETSGGEEPPAQTEEFPSEVGANG